MPIRHFRGIYQKTVDSLVNGPVVWTPRMDSSKKRSKPDVDEGHVDPSTPSEEPEPKSMRTNNYNKKPIEPRILNSPILKSGNISFKNVNHLSIDDILLLEEVYSSCTDFEKLQNCIRLRKKLNLPLRLPEDINDSSYYFEGGLRKVYPYPYIYQATAKYRWLGKKLRDIIKNEFRDIPDDQLKQRFQMNRILVNGEIADYDQVLRNSDFITNRNHRHELPVLAAPLKFIFRDKDTLVINKPPSIPIHTCGRFRHNSVVNVLIKENGIEEPRVCHRLDRLVSGVLIIALTQQRASDLEKIIRDRQVSKYYVCRVKGEFPIGSDETEGKIVVDQPLETIPGKIGVVVVTPKGKPSLTKFKRLNYNGKTSAVLCEPHTGRMHQIRVHLQYLGFPIINDYLYNCSSFGPEVGKGGRYGKSLAQLSTDVINTHRASTWLQDERIDVILPDECPAEIEPTTDFGRMTDDEKRKPFLNDQEREQTLAALDDYINDDLVAELTEKYKFDPAKLIVDPTCRDCHDKYYDPPMRSLFMYLHAYKYEGPGFCYESELPVWAKESWKY